MSLRFASLGSGSEGNALLVQSGKTTVMIDCGFGAVETHARLARLGVMIDQIDAILVTHERSDHVSGVPRLAARYGVPVWMSWGTLMATQSRFANCELHTFDAGAPFELGDLEVTPFAVPHDAREPVQYVVGDGNCRFGVLTDIGMSTPHVERMLSGLDALLLECNHDANLLATSAYPYSLKTRISGIYGHLENSAAAALLGRLDNTRLQHLVAGHLSQSNNRPELAQQALAAVMNCEPNWIGVADQHLGLAWRSVQ